MRKTWDKKMEDKKIFLSSIFLSGSYRPNAALKASAISGWTSGLIPSAS